MIYGTKLLDTDTELFAASLLQQEVLVWSLNDQDVYEQVDRGVILKYAADYVLVRSSGNGAKVAAHQRDQCEFSVRFAHDK